MPLSTTPPAGPRGHGGAAGEQAAAGGGHLADGGSVRRALRVAWSSAADLEPGLEVRVRRLWLTRPTGEGPTRGEVRELHRDGAERCVELVDRGALGVDLPAELVDLAGEVEARPRRAGGRGAGEVGLWWSPLGRGVG